MHHGTVVACLATISPSSISFWRCDGERCPSSLGGWTMRQLDCLGPRNTIESSKNIQKRDDLWCLASIISTFYSSHLVGGFNPSEKSATVKLDPSSPIFGVKMFKIFKKSPPSHDLVDQISSCGKDREDWWLGNKGSVKADGLATPVLAV